MADTIPARLFRNAEQKPGTPAVHEVVDGAYVRIPSRDVPIAESLNPEEQDHPEDNWVWSPQGVVNMHLPGRWGEVVFDGEGRTA